MSAPLRVLVMDDEAPARSRLRDLLADCAGTVPTEVLGEAGNGRRSELPLPAISYTVWVCTGCRAR